MLILLLKIFFKCFGKLFNVLSPENYVYAYCNYLRKAGVEIRGVPNYISPDAYFDIQPVLNFDMEGISLGDGCVISKEVMLLTHDFSIARGIQAVNGEKWGGGVPHFIAGIKIGDNSFIGARSSILPGSSIGRNCIVGACSVVKGVIPDNSIVIGNPAKIIGSTTEWAEKHIKRNDFLC